MDRLQRTHFGSRVKLNIVVLEMIALEIRLAVDPKVSQNLKSFLKDVGAMFEFKSKCSELAANTVFWVSHARPKNGTSLRQHIKCRPLKRKVEGIACRRHQACCTKFDSCRPLRNCRQQTDCFVAGFREQAVTHPD